jgi:hypothetical protein
MAGRERPMLHKRNGLIGTRSAHPGVISGLLLVRRRNGLAYWIELAKPPRVTSARIVSPTFLFPFRRFVPWPT